MIKTLTKFACIAMCMAAVVGCASSYNTINPSKLTKYTPKIVKGVEIAYQAAQLNGKYLDHQKQTGYGFYAVKIVNNTTKPISFKNDIIIKSSGKTLSYMQLNVFYSFIQQNPQKSLKFLFLLPANVYTSKETTVGSNVTSSSGKFYPVGLILGPALAFGNMAAANGANKKFKADLDRYDILDKQIGVGQTEYGFIALSENPLNPLEFVVSQ